MEDFGKLLSLPWQIQLALASGYSAYVLAFTGLRDRHRNVDVLFITLLFGLIATAAMALVLNRTVLGWTIAEVEAGSIAFGLVVGCGLLWRRFGRRLLEGLLRSVKLTWANDDPSALATISDNTSFPVTQISLLLDDGTWLRCDNAYRFQGYPFGPFCIGPNGDVALYLTHVERPDGSEKEQPSVIDPNFGARISYVPASRIRQMNIRHLMKS